MSNRRSDWAVYGLAALVFLFAVEMGMQMRMGDLAPIWPAAGIGVAVVGAVDRRRLGGSLAGLGIVVVATSLLHGASLAEAIAVAVASLAEFLAARVLLTRLWRKGSLEPSFGILVLAWMSFAAVALLGASVGATALAAVGDAAWSSLWTGWFVAHFVGMFVVVPACAAVLSEGPRFLAEGFDWEFAGVVASAVGALAVTMSSSIADPALASVLLVPILWSAVRFGLRQTAVLAAPLSAAVVFFTSRGFGPLAASDSSVGDVRTLVVAVMGVAMVLAVEVSNRRRAVGRLSGTLDAVRDALLTVDQDGVIRWAGQRTREVFSRDPDEVVGMSIERLVRAEQKVDEDWWGRPCAREGGFVADRPDGTTAAIAVSVGRNGWMPGQTVVACRDVSRRVALETEREQLIGTISHELRGPLTAVSGYVDMLLDGEFGQLSRDAVDVLRQVQESAAGMNEIIGELLELRSLGHTSEERTATDLESLVERVVSEMRGAAAAKRVGLEFRGEPVSCEIAPREVQRAVRNLVGNAVKYTRSGGSVDVVLSRTRDVASVVVEDTGVGIPADEIDGLFRPFARASNASRHASGTGLGLVFVKSVAERHGGGVSVTSDLGAGSRFVLALPASPVATEREVRIGAAL